MDDAPNNLTLAEQIGLARPLCKDVADVIDLLFARLCVAKALKQNLTETGLLGEGFLVPDLEGPFQIALDRWNRLMGV